LAVLLLQGPLGPFFKRVSQRLEERGETVYKINFNGGDDLFASSSNSFDFSQSLEDWPCYLDSFVKLHRIKHLFVYGDCRGYHLRAKAVCLKLGVRYHAFEEGYLRPNYITLEEGGVNGHSPIQHGDVDLYKPSHNPKNEIKISRNFYRRAAFSILYYVKSSLTGSKYRFYRHHRSFSPYYELYCWLKAGCRKILYRMTEFSSLEEIKKTPFFLVPLQVHNDAQLEHHSRFDSIEQFITEVLTSYRQANIAARLVIKHHPMDRGHCDYRRYIRDEVARLKLFGKVDYVHDLHLPTLLKKCEGVVTINSTTALQAFYHGASVKVLGNAFFDMKGLTDGKELQEFWHSPEPLDQEFSDRFKAYLLDHGQINGSYYSNETMTLDHLMTYLESRQIISKSVKRLIPATNLQTLEPTTLQSDQQLNY